MNPYEHEPLTYVHAHNISALTSRGYITTDPPQEQVHQEAVVRLSHCIATINRNATKQHMPDDGLEETVVKLLTVADQLASYHRIDIRAALAEHLPT